VSVRAIRTTTISILAVGLLAGSAVGVVAQDEEATDPMAPATFGVMFDFPPETTREPIVTETPLGESRRGEGLVNLPFKAGDPRATGLFTNVNSQETLGNIVASSSRVRIVNENGVWEGTGNGFSRLRMKQGEGPPFNRAASIAILSGEGAYEGLTLVLTQTLDHFHGYIIPTELLPPTPELPAE
jgi:hypothetical protein